VRSLETGSGASCGVRRFSFMATNADNVVINRMPEAQMTINLRLGKSFTWRLQIGVWLIKLGAYILPITTNVEVE